MKFNDFAAWILKSPFHWMMGKGTMLITVAGRKTGKPVAVPVNYHEDGGALWVTSSRDRVWWRNFKDGADATLQLNGKAIKAYGELVSEPDAVGEQMTKMYKKDPMLARVLGVHMDAAGCPDPGDLQRVVKERLLVRMEVKK